MDIGILIGVGAFLLNAIATAIGVFVYIHRREDHIMDATQKQIETVNKRIADLEDVTNDVRTNYIKRFELLTEKLNEIKVDVVREIGEVKLLIQSKA